MVANARDFLLAIKESTHTVFDADAVEFLEGLRDGMTQELNKQRKLTHAQRDSICFFEGMLRGVQIKLAHKKQEAAMRLSKLGLLDGDGKPKVEA